MLPPPHDIEAPVGSLVVELAEHLGVPATVALCVALLEGADRQAHLPELAYLTGLELRADQQGWAEHWTRTWGARGLLYVWEDTAGPAVVGGLADAAWRPAEMCLKVATRREVGEAGPGAARLLGHHLPRVRAQALRTLAVVGDVEHVAAVRGALDDDHVGVRRQAARALEALTVRLDLSGERALSP